MCDIHFMVLIWQIVYFCAPLLCFVCVCVCSSKNVILKYSWVLVRAFWKKKSLLYVVHALHWLATSIWQSCYTWVPVMHIMFVAWLKTEASLYHSQCSSWTSDFCALFTWNTSERTHPCIPFIPFHFLHPSWFFEWNACTRLQMFVHSTHIVVKFIARCSGFFFSFLSRLVPFFGSIWNAFHIQMWRSNVLTPSYMTMEMQVIFCRCCFSWAWNRMAFEKLSKQEVHENCVKEIFSGANVW